MMYLLASSQPILFVCIPGKQNTQQIQSGFDELIGAGKTMAFGRIKDLDAMITSSPVTAIIASEPFFTYTPGYEITLEGTSGNSVGEKYHIVSASNAITLEEISEKKVGIVDFLGKERLPRFVKDQFGIEIKTIRRVNKEEDLLTMIGMEAVDAIIVSESQLEEIESNTKIKLVTIATSASTVGLAVYGQKKGNGNDNQKKILLKAPLSLLKEIGIDGWESH